MYYDYATNLYGKDIKRNWRSGACCIRVCSAACECLGQQAANFGLQGEDAGAHAQQVELRTKLEAFDNVAGLDIAVKVAQRVGCLTVSPREECGDEAKRNACHCQPC